MNAKGPEQICNSINTNLYDDLVSAIFYYRIVIIRKCIEYMRDIRT